jgi:hypothetical protein
LEVALMTGENVLLGQGVGVSLPSGQKWPAGQIVLTHKKHELPPGHTIGAALPGGHSTPRMEQGRQSEPPPGL